jgi:alkylation response protein AidB-like acyl-CoA dehydrogenase
MDFSLSEEQEAVQALSSQIFGENVTHERLLELERSGDWYDMELWKQLAEANLSAICVPEAQGGGGMGFVELCILLEEQGREVAPVPLLPSAVLAGLPIAEFGSAAQKERWLAPIANDAAVLTAAFLELGSSAPARPRVTATPSGDGWRLDGEKAYVPALHLALAVLVPARTPDGVGVFIVEPSAAGIKSERQATSSREPVSNMTLEGVEVGADAVLGDPAGGAAIVDWTVERASLALSAIQLGVCQGALRDTAAYIAQRKQFGRPIATFQGVALRAADAFIDVEALRGLITQAAWRISQGLPCKAEVAAAKYWAAQGGDRVVHTAQHLHGGTGADVEYPIHRYFLWARANGMMFGAGNQQAAEIGAFLVSDERAASL